MNMNMKTAHGRAANALSLLSLSTCWATPWALLMTGGQVPGQRPRTQLAWIVAPVFGNDQAIVGYRVVPFRGDNRPILRPRFAEAGAILGTWRHRPSEAALRRARAALKPVVDAWRTP